MPDINIHPASFRDPSGFVFQWNNKYYRQVNKIYADDYNLLMQSGLYQYLIDNKLIISHTETRDVTAETGNCYKTLLPYQVPFITYPYEWCFDQLKDAALLTLKIVNA